MGDAGDIDLVILGNTVADVIVHPVGPLPEPGLSVHVEGARFTFGGCGANTAISAAKLGARVRLYSAVGTDEVGAFVREQLARRPGLDATGVAAIDGAPTSMTIVLVRGDGQRSFVCYSGASGRVTRELLPEDFLAGARHFHYGGFYLLPDLMGETAGALLRAAQARGLTTSLDVAWKQGVDLRAAILPSLRHADYAMPNVDEACAISGERGAREAAAWLVEQGAGTALVTMGEHGVEWATREGSGRLRAYRVGVVDTTGAGDAFSGAFCAITLEAAREPYWQPLERRVRFAAAAGALACTALGGDEGLRDRQQVLDLMGSR